MSSFVFFEGDIFDSESSVVELLVLKLKRIVYNRTQQIGHIYYDCIMPKIAIVSCPQTTSTDFPKYVYSSIILIYFREEGERANVNEWLLESE